MVSRRQLLKISALGSASFAAPLAYSASNTTMAYSTGNPIGSSSPKDLSDNARNLDYLLLGPNPSYPDRLGVPRKSWIGMEGEFDADQTRRKSDFDAAQNDRHQTFSTFMDASGYEPPVPYAPGLAIVRITQTVTYLGKDYRVKTQFLPLTTTIWAMDEPKLKLIGDDSLRQDVANATDPEKGAGMTGWTRAPLAQSIANVHQMLDAQAVSPWEFAHLVSVRPKAADPTTWDWTPAFAAMHAAVAAGLVKMIALTGAYRLVGGLSPKGYEWSDVTILSAGGIIILDSPTGDNIGMQIGSNVTIKGHLKGGMAKGSGNGNGFVRTPICIGRWWDSGEVSNVHIDSLDLTGMTDGTAMAIAGNTHGVKIDRLKLSGGQLGLMMHWSGLPENIAPSKTYHPHDIHIGSITGSGFTDAMVTSSGCYDIRIDYINGQNNYRDFYSIGGDFGEKFAVARDLGKVCKGISLGRVTSSGAIYRSVEYNASAGKTTNVMLGEFGIESIKAVGTGAENSVGIRIENRDCGRIGFADVSGFANNIVQINCNGGIDGELRSSGATGQGIIYSATKHVRVEQLRTTNDNKAAGGGVGGVNVNAQCNDIQIGSLRVSTNNTATHGCVLESGSSSIRIQQTNGVVDSTRFLVVDGAPANSNRVGPCVTDGGAVSYSGQDPFSSTTARGHSMSWGGGEPGAGVFKRGDISMAASAAPGGKAGRICTTAGTAGSTAVFKPWGTIDL